MLEAQVNLASLASLANLVSLVNLASLVNLVSLASLVNLVSLDSLVNLDSPPMTQRSRRRATLPSDRSDHPVPSFPCIQCIPWLTFPVPRSPFPVPRFPFPVSHFTNSSVKDRITPKGLGRFGKAGVFFLPLCFAKRISPLCIKGRVFGG